MKNIVLAAFWLLRIGLTLSVIYGTVSIILWKPIVYNPIIFTLTNAAWCYVVWVAKYTQSE